MHELVKNTYFQTLNNFNTAIVDGKFPVSGSFISAEPFPWWIFLIRVGTLNSAITVQVQQDTGATQTGSIKILQAQLTLLRQTMMTNCT